MVRRAASITATPTATPEWVTNSESPWTSDPLGRLGLGIWGFYPVARVGVGSTLVTLKHGSPKTASVTDRLIHQTCG